MRRMATTTCRGHDDASNIFAFLRQRQRRLQGLRARAIHGDSNMAEASLPCRAPPPCSMPLNEEAARMGAIGRIAVDAISTVDLRDEPRG